MRLTRTIPALTLLHLLLVAPTVLAGVSGPLDILLTNDDGWDSVGIQTLKLALEAVVTTSR